MDEIKNKIQKSRLKWSGHLMQMREEKIPKKMLYTKWGGGQSRGRPTIRWIDNFERI